MVQHLKTSPWCITEASSRSLEILNPSNYHSGEGNYFLVESFRHYYMILVEKEVESYPIQW